ncbi:MAG: alpha/beta hydrolase-fold protein [Bacteroidota bacterium]
MKSGAFFFSLLFSISSLFAQQTYDFEYEVESEVFSKDRKFYVHLHEDYYFNDIDSFGVVYVLDAQADAFYQNAKGIIDYLVWVYQITPLIVVGIHSDSRYKEFIPQDRSLPSDSPDNVGEAEKLQAHLREEVFPKISEDFRVRDFRAVIGHSRGGAFLANTLFGEQKDLFHAYLSISPGMHYLDNQILEDAEDMIQAEASFHKFFYCSHGTVGSLEERFKLQVDHLDSLFTTHPTPTIHWEKRTFEGKTHWTTVAPAITEGILAMNRAYQVDQYLIEAFAKQADQSLAAQMSAYAKQQEVKLGSFMELEPYRLRRYGDDFSEREHHRRALELYEMSLEAAPNDITTYLRKASVYRELSEPEKAEAVYQAALEVLDRNEAEWEEEKIEENREKILRKLENMKKNQD